MNLISSRPLLVAKATAARAGNAGQAISLCDHEERDAIERLTRLILPKTDRRGAAGPKPAHVVRKAAVAPAPAPQRPHHAPHRDARSDGLPIAGRAHRPGQGRPQRRIER